MSNGKMLEMWLENDKGGFLSSSIDQRKKTKIKIL
jgi:hypothetical protein